MHGAKLPSYEQAFAKTVTDLYEQGYDLLVLPEQKFFREVLKKLSVDKPLDSNNYLPRFNRLRRTVLSRLVSINLLRAGELKREIVALSNVYSQKKDRKVSQKILELHRLRCSIYERIA